MNERDRSRIGALCAQLKAAIIIAAPQTNLFAQFPHGCCRDASLLLAEFLAEHGWKKSIYCSTDYDVDHPSHAWIEYENLVIDLTAEQFNSQLASCIVRTEHRKTYSYIADTRQSYSLSIAGTDGVSLLQDYRRFKSYLS